MTTSVSSKGQIVLPVKLRRLDKIESGQKFEIERLDCGNYRLLRQTPSTSAGLVDLLLACPVKGWFQTIESESTDTL